MAKKDILKRITELNELKREIEDLAKELQLGDLSDEKIMIAIKAYQIALRRALEKEIDGR